MTMFVCAVIGIVLFFVLRALVEETGIDTQQHEVNAAIGNAPRVVASTLADDVSSSPQTRVPQRDNHPGELMKTIWRKNR